MDTIEETIGLYVDGASRGDAAKLRRAFHEDARMFGSLGGQRVDLPLAELIELSVAHPLDSDGSYRARIAAIDDAGDAATVRLEEDGCWGAVSFVDLFVLSRFDDGWKIVNKTFSHAGGTPPF